MDASIKYPQKLDRFFPHHGGGGLHFRLRILSPRLAYWAKIHEYASGKRIVLSYDYGHPVRIGPEWLRLLHEHEGHLAYYEPGDEKDLPTADHVTGWRKAAAEYRLIRFEEDLERQDEINSWMY